MKILLTKITLSLLICLFSTGCLVRTSGGGSWELYVGVRTQQTGELPAEVEVESKMLDFLTEDGTTSEKIASIIKGLIWAAGYFL